MDKKAQLSGAPNTVLTFVVLVIVIAVGGIVLSGIKDTYNVDNSSAYNASYKGLEGVEKWSTFLPTIAIVMVSALLIAIVVGAFVYMRSR